MMILSQCIFGVLAVTTNATETAAWHIDASKPLHAVSPSLYGIFFEEINCAGDGGIYAEQVRNRGFEDADDLVHWKVAAGRATLTRDNPISSASPTSLSVGSGTVLENEGYWGISAREGDRFNFSFYARGASGQVRAELVSNSGGVLGSANLDFSGGDWRQTKAAIKSSGSDSRAKLRLRFTTTGAVQIDMVSLFPAKTWKGRANGLRPDLMGLLSELRPSFVRFPGGCWVEGETMDLAQRWKTTVGELRDRRTQPNIWRYMSTNGLGYHEYLQMCEDLGSDALFVVNCGMSHREVVPMDKMDEFVQDALDAVEYAIGPTSTKWGALRAKNGHPKPFPLRFVEIGNENGGPAYEERYGLIYRALKSKYPGVHLIANLWGGRPQKTPVDILDEHYYSNPDFFINNADRYDRYDRKGPRIYVGEYAVTQDNGNGSLKGALAEAAFMTGMERNADVVVMSSYAPLFANVSNKAWNPDLIYFDSSRVIATPSYYVQKLFFRNRADHVLGSVLKQPASPKRSFPTGGIGVGTWNTHADFKDIRVTQGDKVLFTSADGSGMSRESGTWTRHDGVTSQTSGATHARLFTGGPAWKNYTLELKARKVSGAEGFLITLGRRGNQDYIWWNLGGWGNTMHGVELATNGGKSILNQTPGKIETGRWYDIKVEYGEDRIRGFIDGKLALDLTMPVPKSLHGVAGVDASGDTVILKVVNVSDSLHTVDVDLESTGWNRISGSVETLSGKDRDENDFDNPVRVAPKRVPLGIKPPQFNYQISPRTLAILRVKKA